MLRKLGRGGMAEVYLAQQDGLNRQVALKVLRPDRLDEDDQTMIRRFEQEALAAAALNHPNIVQVHSVGRVDGAGPNGGPLHYIAQEYVPGPTLRDYLKRKGPPGAKIAVRLMREICRRPRGGGGRRHRAPGHQTGKYLIDEEGPCEGGGLRPRPADR